MKKLFKTKKAALKHLRTPVEFEKLTKAEQRVWIAKDILAAIETGAFEVGYGYGQMWGRYFRPGPMREQMVNVKCAGCALSAAFFCSVARTNKFDVQTQNLRGSESESNWVGFHLSQYRDRLREIFDKQQIDEIEMAYEGWGHYGTAVNDFCDDLPEYDIRRIKRIFQNVIANNGTFIP